MKLFINDYEIEIKARELYNGKKRATQESAVRFLLELVYGFDNAAKQLDEKGLVHSAKSYRRMSNDIYNQLETSGALKDIEKAV